ncbi:MAG: exodeoxyribonuclease VII large subunit, partial [Dehalococcoidia bacterium]|nr:exodeoxyribonuclease VII large subunit [Dehalococcoidia bacterium]
MEPLEPTDVLSYINERIELDERLSDLWVVGEVSDYTRSQQGHRYFSLKDGYSSLRSVMFRTEMPGVDLEPGDSVIA